LASDTDRETMMAEPAPRTDGLVIEGLAIVSADGMIANAAGTQPEALKLEADQRFFHDHLRAADVLVHGRHSGEGGPDAARRRRIILTRGVDGAARDPANANGVLWNPAGASFEQAWALLGVPGGRAAIIGGTDVFGLFLERGYDIFHLSRAAGVELPGGRPVFPGVPERSPEQLLASQGLKPDTTRVLDRSAGLTLTTWRR
jgi:dihydrofolate reductase